MRGNPKLYHFTGLPVIEQTIFLNFGFLTSEMNKWCLVIEGIKSLPQWANTGWLLFCPSAMFRWYMKSLDHFANSTYLPTLKKWQQCWSALTPCKYRTIKDIKHVSPFLITNSKSTSGQLEVPWGIMVPLLNNGFSVCWVVLSSPAWLFSEV